MKRKARVKVMNTVALMMVEAEGVVVEDADEGVDVGVGATEDGAERTFEKIEKEFEFLHSQVKDATENGKCIVNKEKFLRK